MPYYRIITPPSPVGFEDFNAQRYRGSSASTNGSHFTQNGSPRSARTVGTNNSTPPPRSPPKIREYGPTLLPRVRPRDEVVEYGINPHLYGHSRATSLPAHDYPVKYLAGSSRLPESYERSRSPFGNEQLLTPPFTGAYDHLMRDATSRQKSHGTESPLSAANVRAHSRNSSSTSIDPTTLGRYGFPTYRLSPAPHAGSDGTYGPVERTPSAMNHLAPIPMPDGHYQSYPSRRRTVSPPANRSRLSREVEFDPHLDTAETSILEYLTAPNPTPSVTRRTAEPSRSRSKHFWFDIRNVQSWSDFNIETLSSMPGMLNLLEVQIPLRNLAQPGRVNTSPETQAHLTELCASHHAVKVNAGLTLALGKLHMAMRSLRPVSGGRQQPEFVSNLQCDIENTVEGDRRGRVVGIVKCFDQWNSGLRTTDPNDRVKYLRGLAQLHYFMRQHGTRYGFIITEIELVCVRAGGPSQDATNVPLFGFLEVASTIRISTHGPKANGKPQMTADLALWYLHMLAKEQPLPNQMYWKMDVGAPAALTRHNHLARDNWISMLTGPSTVETREAKRSRGWIWPGEPLARKETGHPRRRK